jgi:hypothetical protein
VESILQNFSINIAFYPLADIMINAAVKYGPPRLGQGGKARLS